MNFKFLSCVAYILWEKEINAKILGHDVKYLATSPLFSFNTYFHFTCSEVLVSPHLTDAQTYGCQVLGPVPSL